MGDNEGVDGEIEEVEGKLASEESRFGMDLPSERGVALSSDNKCKASQRHITHSDRQHHQNNGDQRCNDTDNNLSNLDKRTNRGHFKKCPNNEVDSNTTNKNVSRAHNRSHKSKHQHSRQNARNSTEDEEPLAKTPIFEKDNRDLHGISLKGETEDGEILEDGELADDKEAAESQQTYAGNDHMEVSSSKSSNKKVNKGGKSERKKSRNREKRNHENDTKNKKKKNYANDDDNFQDEKIQGPMWGSGYQKRQQENSIGSKGYRSPHGLYDSPQEGSDEELMVKSLLTGGYIDASVAAAERQGIFNRKVSLGRAKKRKYEKNSKERKQNAESRFEGPPKKKSLLDMQMSERPACKFYLEGKCAKGGMCPFNHDVEKPKKLEVCKYHMTFKGCIRQTCQYMHHFPCKYYHTGGKCFSGDRCKFSHDPLTETTQKALEMRLAAEDTDMENPSNSSEQRLREANNKPSLLGSPPPMRPELRKIPCLLDIEVHQPGHSPKLPLPQFVRPSGFYSDRTETSIPGPINNIGLMKNVIASNLNSQLSNQCGSTGAGLLPMPVRPGNMNGFKGSIIGNQQGLSSQHQRFGMGPSVPMKNTLPQNGHMSPVLNMLGAIIHEAATHKGPNGQINMMSNANMSINSMSPNLNIVNNGDHNKVAPDSIASNTSLESMNSSFTQARNNAASYKQMAPMKLVGNTGPNSIEDKIQVKDIVSNVSLNHIIQTASSGQQNVLEESLKTDVDGDNNKRFGDMEESQDICELNKIRQQIQAQIDEEEEKEVIEDEELQNDQPLTEKPADIQEKEGLSSCTTLLEKRVNIDIPPHLPKKQQELFIRIQQQQLLREKELDKEKIQITAEESEAKDADDWYSSDEEGETKPKLTDVLKKLNQEPSSHVSGSSSVLETHDTNPSEQKTVPSAASTFNIMQMINAIKGQSMLSKPVIGNTETSSQALKLSLPPDNLQGLDTMMSPASPPTVSTSIMKSFGVLHNVSNCQPPPLAVDPPVVNAVLLKPLNYVAVRISLDMPKPYAQLLDPVIVADPAFKDDPRVKWHISYIEREVPKEPQNESSSEDRSQKQSNTQLVKESNDAHLSKQSNSSSSERQEVARSADPRLHRNELQPLPANPRLARLASGNFDPRLNRQIIQTNPNDNDIFNKSGGAMAVNSVIMANQVGNFINSPMNNMAPMHNIGVLNNNVTGRFNSQIGSSIGNFSMDGHNRLGHSGPLNMIESVSNNMNMMGRPMNNVCGEMSQMHSLNMMRAQQEPFFGLGGSRMMTIQENTIEDPVCQPNQLHADPSLIGSGVYNLSDPRLKGQNVLNEMQGNSDPRLRHRPINPREQQHRSMDPIEQPHRTMDPREQQHRTMDPREQQHRTMDPREQQHRSMEPRNQHFNMNDSSFFRMSPNSDTVSSSTIEGSVNHRTLVHPNNFKPFENGLKQQKEMSQSIHIAQSNTVSFNTQEHSKITHGREGLNHGTDNGDGLLPCPSVSSFVSRSNTDVNASPKFDHRSDPRFRRLKKMAGQQKDSVEYSSPLGDDKYVVGPGGNNQCSSDYNSYNRSRSGKDPRVRAVHSPQLPDSLQDFGLPVSSSLNVTEPGVQVKHLFKTIDPTASPFC